MSIKTKKKKRETFSEIAEKNPPKVIEEAELLPEKRELVVVKEFAKPLVNVEEASGAFRQYQELMEALMKESDIVEIQGKKMIKKTGINKIARFFGVSVEIIRHHKEEIIGPQGGRSFVWYVWTRATLPNGQSRVEGAACASNERRFAHLENDVLTTAITRSSKRAIENLVGMGALELDEDGEDSNPSEEMPQNGDQSDNNNNYMGTGDPDTWKPIFKVNSFSKFVPSNDKMPISEKATEWIKASIKRAGVELDDNTKVLFILNNRADGQPRTKEISQLNKGDFYDISETIKRKGKEGLIKLLTIIKNEVPAGELPSEENPQEPQSNGSIYNNAIPKR